MPLHLITGPAACAKSRLVHEPLLSAAARGDRAMLVLPTSADVRRASSVFASQGTLGLGFATFGRLIENLWFAHGDGRSLVSPAVREILVGQALRQCSLTLLDGSSSTPGFARLIAGICSRAIGPVDVAGRSGQSAEIARVIEAYHGNLMSLGLIEAAQAAAYLAGASGVISGPVGIYGFTDLSEHQELLLAGLAREVDVYLAVSWEEGAPATEAMDELVRRLVERCDTHAVVRAEPPETELALVAARLFQPSDPPLRATGELQLAEADGQESECAQIAELVKRWVSEDGIAPDRIAVGFRSLEARAPYLEAALESVGLSAAIDRSATFGATPLGAAALALVDTAAGVGGRERFLAFVQSPFSGIEAQEACRLDAVWRRRRETRSAALLEAVCEAGELPASAVRAARHVVGHALDGDCVQQWQKLADTLIEAGSRVRPFGSARALEDAAAYRALLEAVAEISRVCPAATATDVVGAVQDATVAPGANERPGAVLVTEVHRLRGRRFEAVVIGGLTSGEFSSERQDPLIATVLKQLGMASGVSERLSERMLFHTIVTRASRRLGLVRQTVDAAGRALRPSVFWEEILDLYRAVGAVGEEHAEEEAGPFVDRSSAKPLLESAPAFSAERERLRVEAAKRGIAWRPLLGVADRNLLDELSSTERFRVTEIETYAACPYRWFWSEKLRTRPLDSEIGAAERGAIAHSILAGFYRDGLPALGVPRMRAEIVDKAIAEVRKSAGAAVAAMRTPMCGLEEELAVAKASAWAEAVVADDVEWLPGFVPVGVEVPVGEDRPFELGGVRLYGRFDRADVSAQGVVVTDYKSSKSVVGADKFIEQGLIQVVAYAEAAAAIYGRPVAGGLYRSLQSLSARGFAVEGLCDVPHRGKAEDVLSPEGFSALRDSVEELVARCAEGIRAGRIAPEPAKDACAYCGAVPFCPKAKAGYR